MKFRIAAHWKRAFRLGLVIVIFIFLVIFNKYHFVIGFNFIFESEPIEKKQDPSAVKALETQIFENLTVRHRDGTA